MTRHHACTRCGTRHYPRCPMAGSDTRWPTAPLIEAAGGAMALARALNWKGKGFGDTISDRQADRYAVRLGLHPSQIWGTAWYDAALTQVDRDFLAGGWRPRWLAQQPSAEAAA